MRFIALQRSLIPLLLQRCNQPAFAFTRTSLLLMSSSDKDPPPSQEAVTDAAAAAASSSDTKAAACIPCSTMDKSFLIDVTELPSLVTNRLPLWELAADSKSISRKFVARNFQAALDAMNSMGAIAEEQSHHPNFHLTNYRELEIEVFTHKLDGLTETDFTLATLLDAVEIDYSPKWLREHPAAEGTAKKSQQ